MKLSQFLLKEELAWISALFSFDLNEIEVVVQDIDGPGVILGQFKLSNKNTIYLDAQDLQSMLRGDILETVIHELKHAEQYRRGFFYRFKMRCWNAWASFFGGTPPHEQEAYDFAAMAVTTRIV